METRKIEKIGSNKNIWFNFPGSNIETFVVMIEYNLNGFSQTLIKWSVATGGIPLYYMIDSLKPLRVLTGIAPFSEYICYKMIESEDEILNFVENLTLRDLIPLMESAVFISYRDKEQMMVPPGGEINLYTPSAKEIEERDKLLKIFHGVFDKIQN